MKHPYYFADEKELFARIFELSGELTRNLERPRGESPRVAANGPGENVKPGRIGAGDDRAEAPGTLGWVAGGQA